MIPVMLGVTIVISSIVYAAPGNPARLALGDGASPEAVAQLEQEMGLDQPAHIRYFDWMAGVLQGDLGTSIQSGRAVTTLIIERLGPTLELALVAMALTVIIAIPLGVISAVRQYSWVDNTSMFFAIFWLSMPSFWLGLILIYLFAVRWQFFPVSGREGVIFTFTWWSFILLPAIATGTRRAGLLTRLMRSSMLEILNEDYIRTARGKGIGSKAVIYTHGMKNALIPVVTLIGLQVPLIFSGTVIIEVVFSWPGMGRLLVDAVLQRDYPVVQGTILVYSVIVMVANFGVDIAYTYLDPRIDYS
ncbi:binding-protein-dependent transport system inner membrane protein [Natrialba magadii ATCC 43099]|uniref:Binding-protein-dependent transport system inner membrane protein n=2 Tax=Natrialba magadii (strain ATCC 43099 / DSM 3394 / CCM 3739 / CIP 104546 / IAM 13178 / JCM 8861 / NBRC 102185 / NCIMB 2190 / MS3) TaxID=547559 RepID=L9UR49_NATMM|nr:binding-protein-dependent transport system inner membrane protein [Natrialba magadii ATCC 43099]